MGFGKIIDSTSYIIGIATFLFSAILFYTQSGVFLGSIAAAIIAAGLFWASYIMIRVLWLALK